MNNSEFIFKFLSKKGCDKVFSIIGGHAMHLNAAQHKIFSTDVIYLHNEQALSMAAESYSRITKKPSIVSVTSAPAALNCLNGVLGAFIDNIPLIIISGQPRNSLCSTTVNQELRQYGDQEFSKIIDVVDPIVKFAKKLNINDDIEFEITNAYKIATNGRPGPVWIDIPIDVQKEKFVKKNSRIYFDEISDLLVNPKVLDSQINFVLEKISKSKRPIIYAGTDIITSDSKKEFLDLLKKLNIPVVLEWNAYELIEEKLNLFVGRPGLRGDRIGNIITYRSDLILAIGSNLSIRQVGDIKNKFSPESFKIMVSVDKNEIYKPNLSIDFPICSNVKFFINKLRSKIRKNKNNNFKDWTDWCHNKKNEIIKFDKYKDSKNINPYNAIDLIFKELPENKITIIGNGISVVGAFQKAQIKKDDIIFQNVGCASMGYDIPATVGACFSQNKKKPKKIFCLTGDGSFQFNFQELQTINKFKFNVTIFVINNGGYSSMKQSQNKFISSIGLHGVDEKTGVSFPSLEKISKVYEFNYLKASNFKNLKNTIRKLNYKKKNIVEIFVDKKQNFEPKVSSKVNEFGGFEVDDLYDMSPKIPKDELIKIMELNKEII
jgi:acetolactate synthase-1/2/3 large subunit